MKQYKDLVQKVLDEGVSSGDRTGTGTRRIFGHSMAFDCSEQFNLVTLKYTHLPAIVHELLWFIAGGTNTKYLTENKVKIWNEWADDNGNLGPIYGSQWRNANGRFNSRANIPRDGVDQLANIIDQIKNNPTSRRIIVDAWQVRDLPLESLSPQENVGLGKMALAPCHMFFQCFVHPTGHLDLQMYQR